MMIPKKDVDILTSLGLSKLQAKVYLASAKMEDATAQKISENLQVARQQVYPAAKELEEMGLVETTLDKSLRIISIPVSDAVSILLHRRYRERDEAEKQASELATRYKRKNRNITSNVEKTEFMLIPEKNALSIKLQKSIDAAQESIDFWLPKNNCLQALFNLSDNFLKALEKGVRIRCAIDEHIELNSMPLNVTRIMEHPLFELKVSSATCNEAFRIYDKQIVIIGCQPRQDYVRARALWTNNEPLVRIVQHYFETMWKEAKPARRKFVELKRNK